MNEVLLFVHIVAGMVWIGGGVLMTLLSMRMAKADAQTRMRFGQESGKLGALFGISALVVLLAGITMVLRDERWDFSQTWVWLALVLIAVSLLVGGAYYGRTGKRIGAALADGQSDEADRLTRQMSTVSAVDMVVLFAIVWLMVAKPGA